jgi:hypothetical protein
MALRVERACVAHLDGLRIVVEGSPMLMAEHGSAVMRVLVRCDRAAPSAVRAWLCELDHLEWVIGDAMLVASELVTNAVLRNRGAEGWVEVVITRTAEAIRVSVTDGGPPRDERDERGRDPEGRERLGMIVVEALTRRWGVDPGPRHTVWAELYTVG